MSKLTVNEKNLCTLDKDFLISNLLDRAKTDPVFERKLRHDLFIKHDPYDLCEHIRRRCQSWKCPQGLIDVTEGMDEELTEEFDQYISWIPELISIDPYHAGEVVFDLIGWVMRIESYKKDMYLFFYKSLEDEIFTTLVNHWGEILAAHPLDAATFVNHFLSLPEYGFSLMKRLHQFGDEFLSAEITELLVRRLSQIISTLKVELDGDDQSDGENDGIESRSVANVWHKVEDVEGDEDIDEEDVNEKDKKEYSKKVNLLRDLKRMHDLFSIFTPGGPEEYLEPFIEKSGTPEGVFEAVESLFRFGKGLGVRKILSHHQPFSGDRHTRALMKYQSLPQILIRVGEYGDGFKLLFELLKHSPSDLRCDSLMEQISDVQSRTSEDLQIAAMIFEYLKEGCLVDDLPLRTALYMWTKLPVEMGGNEYFNKLIFLRQRAICEVPVILWGRFINPDESQADTAKDQEKTPYNYHSAATQVSWYLIHKEIAKATARYGSKSEQKRTKPYYAYIASRILDARRLYQQIPLQQLQQLEDQQKDRLEPPDKYEQDLRAAYPKFIKLVDECLASMKKHDEVKISKEVGSTYFKVPDYG